MTEMRIGQVIDALVAGLGATAGFFPSTTTSAAAGTIVWDGPTWQTVEDHGAGGNVVIGWSREKSPSATSTWESGPIAGTKHPRDEVTQLACLATAQRHATAKGARDEAIAITTALAAYCRADPSLGINTGDTIGGVRTLTFLTGGTMTQFVDRGFTCEIEFTITYKARV